MGRVEGKEVDVMCVLYEKGKGGTRSREGRERDEEEAKGEECEREEASVT